MYSFALLPTFFYKHDLCFYIETWTLHGLVLKVGLLQKKLDF